MDGIHHGVYHVERIRIVASRKIRVPFTANLHRAQELFLLDTSHQRNFRFGSIVQGQKVQGRRRGQGFEGARRSKLFFATDVRQFLTALERTHRNSETGTRHNGIYVGLVRRQVNPGKQRDCRKNTERKATEQFHHPLLLPDKGRQRHARDGGNSRNDHYQNKHPDGAALFFDDNRHRFRSHFFYRSEQQSLDMRNDAGLV